MKLNFINVLRFLYQVKMFTEQSVILYFLILRKQTTMGNTKHEGKDWL